MSIEQHFSDDGGRHIEWGRTSADYAEHRPNYPLNSTSGWLTATLAWLGKGFLILARALVSWPNSSPCRVRSSRASTSMEADRRRPPTSPSCRP